MTRLRPAGFGEPVEPSGVGGDLDARVKAIAARGFTERQARFLVLVLRHAGVCVPGQYAHFAGTAQGAKCNTFFARLVQQGHAVAVDCLHNRGRLYRLHSRALYDAIGSSRYRRTVSPRVALERLTRLDAMLLAPDLAWFTGSAEKAAALNLPPTQTPPDACPIGVDADGRLVVLYLVTEWRPDAFRAALRTCAAAVLAAPRWTLRIAVPRDIERLYARYVEVAHEELERLFEGLAAARLVEGWERGAMRVEPLVLAHAPPVISLPWLTGREGGRRWTQRGLRRGKTGGRWPSPASTPGLDPLCVARPADGPVSCGSRS